MAALPIIPIIAEPCTQSWEQMPGTARVRHCASCNQDVVNLAAMSSAEITRLLAGPVPCLRLARYEDGTLVTTEPTVARPMPRIAAGLLTAAMLAAAGAQQDRRAQTVTVGAPMPAPTPLVMGTVTDHSGNPIPQATVTLLQHGKIITSLKLGPDGKYTLTAPAGAYNLRVEAPNSIPVTSPVQLSPQQPVTRSLELAPNKRQTLFMGRIAAPVKPAAPKTVQPTAPSSPLPSLSR